MSMESFAFNLFFFLGLISLYSFVVMLFSLWRAK